MHKNYIKRFIIILSLVCFVTHVSFASSISEPSINTVISSSLDTLSNIQRQLEAISRNIYTNTSVESNKNALEQLAIYSNQLNTVKNTLESIPEESIDMSQIDTYRGLLTVERFLDYMELKLSTLAQTNDTFERYDLLNSIFVTNTLVDIIISNINIPLPPF